MRVLGVSRRTLARMVERGELAPRVGDRGVRYFPRAEVHRVALLERARRGPLGEDDAIALAYHLAERGDTVAKIAIYCVRSIPWVMDRVREFVAASVTSVEDFPERAPAVPRLRVRPANDATSEPSHTRRNGAPS